MIPTTFYVMGLDDVAFAKAQGLNECIGYTHLNLVLLKLTDKTLIYSSGHELQSQGQVK